MSAPTPDPRESRTALLVRLDATPEIGAGHATRCGALAHALRSLGARVAFAATPASAERVSPLVEAGFAVHEVPAADVRALGPADLAATVETAEAVGAAGVLVDHYGADGSYLDGLRAAGLDVAVVDDLADRDLSAARWVLNQTLGAEALPYPEGAVTALGPAYALLRAQFADERARLLRSFEPGDRRVLVTYGGGDTALVAGRALAALDAVELPLEVRVALGSDAPPPRTLADAARRSHHAVELLGHVRAMAREMAWADVSLNAGGSSCWELACLGTPMVVTPLSRDQVPIASALDTAGAALAVPEPALEGAGAVVDALLRAPRRRAALSAAASRLVDGHGAHRAAASLLGALAREATHAR